MEISRTDRLPLDPDLHKSGEAPLVPPQIIFFMGPEGSGKSTQANILGRRTNLPVISAGGVFRKLINSTDTSDLVNRAKAFSDRGGYADAALFKDVMEWWFLLDKDDPKRGEELKGVNFRNGVIIEGAPRTADQVDVMADIAKQYIGDLPMHLVFVNMPRSRAPLRQAGRDARPDDADLDKRLDDHYKDLADKVRGVLGYGGKLVIVPSVVRDKETGEVAGDRSIEEVNQEIIQKLGIEEVAIRTFAETDLKDSKREVVDLDMGRVGHDINTLPKMQRRSAILAYIKNVNTVLEETHGDAQELVALKNYLEQLYSENI